MTPRTEPGHPAEELSALIARSRRRVWTLTARRLEQVGESVHTWQVLKLLHKWGPLAQHDLAARSGQHPAGVSRMLEAMERNGLVRRKRDPRDRRKVRVEASAAGLARLRRMQPQFAEAAERAFERLSATERRSLKGLLEKLLAGDPGP